MLSVAWPAAKMMINKALEMAYVGKGSVNSYLLERYFGPDWRATSCRHPRRVPEDHRQLVRLEPTFECLAQTAESCPNDDPHYVTLAYVTKKRHVSSTPTPYGDVRVCREGFLHSMGNLQRSSRRSCTSSATASTTPATTPTARPARVRPLDREGDRQRRLLRPVRPDGVQPGDLNRSRPLRACRADLVDAAVREQAGRRRCGSSVICGAAPVRAGDRRRSGRCSRNVRTRQRRG